MGGVRSWISAGGKRRGTLDTESTVADGDLELGERKVVGWPLESGRGRGRGRGEEARSESEENIIEGAGAPMGGIVKTVKVDVR